MTQSEIRKRYYQKNRRKILAKTKTYYQKNKVRLRAYAKAQAISAKHPCIDCGVLCRSESTRCKPCAIKFRWLTTPHPFKRLKGADNPSWKGGKTKDSHGYIWAMAHGHPRANKSGYVQEHILVWEQVNSKPLPKGWIIHHLNGIKDDNRTCNLQALPNKKHYFLLQAKAKRIQELEALLNGQAQLI